MNINSEKHDVEDLVRYLSGKKIILYGAGKISRSIIDASKKLGIDIDQIWDNKCDQLDDIEAIKPDLSSTEKNESVIIVTIFAQKVSEQIRNELSAQGFQNILFRRAVINKLLYSVCEAEVQDGTYLYDLDKCHRCPVSKDLEQRCDIYDQSVKKSFLHTKREGSTGIIIPSMGILVSNKCNLTCQGCNQLRDQYVPADYLDIKADEVISDTRKLCSAVDQIEKVVIVGGEAFLHKDINKILKEILSIENIGIIQLITNGTVIPKNSEIFELMSNPRIKLEVSGYGEHLSEKLQQNVKIFLAKLTEHHVNYDYVKTLQWFDFGGFEKRNYSNEQWQDTYNTCCFISNDLFNGELHKCARSVFGKHLHKVSAFHTDYVNVRTMSANALTEAMRAFLDNTKPQICQYCNGTSATTIEAGIQVDKGRS
jgi:organic radical activating enzyme